MSRIADVLEITSTEFDGRFEILGCRYTGYVLKFIKDIKNI